VIVIICSGATVVVNVTLEREDEIAGPILAPFFPQVTLSILFLAVSCVLRDYLRLWRYAHILCQLFIYLSPHMLMFFPYLTL